MWREAKVKRENSSKKKRNKLELWRWGQRGKIKQAPIRKKKCFAITDIKKGSGEVTFYLFGLYFYHLLYRIIESCQGKDQIS